MTCVIINPFPWFGNLKPFMIWDYHSLNWTRVKSMGPHTPSHDRQPYLCVPRFLGINPTSRTKNSYSTTKFHHETRSRHKRRSSRRVSYTTKVRIIGQSIQKKLYFKAQKTSELFADFYQTQIKEFKKTYQQFRTHESKVDDPTQNNSGESKEKPTSRIKKASRMLLQGIKNSHILNSESLETSQVSNEDLGPLRNWASFKGWVCGPKRIDEQAETSPRVSDSSTLIGSGTDSVPSTATTVRNNENPIALEISNAHQGSSSRNHVQLDKPLPMPPTAPIPCPDLVLAPAQRVIERDNRRKEHEQRLKDNKDRILYSERPPYRSLSPDIQALYRERIHHQNLSSGFQGTKVCRQPFANTAQSIYRYKNVHDISRRLPPIFEASSDDIAQTLEGKEIVVPPAGNAISPRFTMGINNLHRDYFKRVVKQPNPLSNTSATNAPAESSCVATAAGLACTEPVPDQNLSIDEMLGAAEGDCWTPIGVRCISCTHSCDQAPSNPLIPTFNELRAGEPTYPRGCPCRMCNKETALVEDMDESKTDGLASRSSSVYSDDIEELIRSYELAKCISIMESEDERWI